MDEWAADYRAVVTAYEIINDEAYRAREQARDRERGRG